MSGNLVIGAYNICLGEGANLTTESYQLVIIPQGCEELRTTMTPSEFEVVNRVIRRALGESLVEAATAIA